MLTKKIDKQKFKKQVLEFLNQEDFENKLKDVHMFLPMKFVNVLFSILVTTDNELKDRVIKTFGEVVSKMAEEDIESARIVMRRLMLSVTEESGGIGWNTPEAMGEIMAGHDGLAQEAGAFRATEGARGLRRHLRDQRPLQRPEAHDASVLGPASEHSRRVQRIRGRHHDPRLRG